MALTRRNYLDIPKVFPLAAKLGVFAVNLEPVTVNTPLVVKTLAASSTKLPVTSPAISAASFVPVIVIVIVSSVPSAVVTVNVSVSVAPAPRDWIAA